MTIAFLLQSAAPALAFDPNLILSDRLAEDYQSMTLDAVQNFLKERSGILGKLIDLDVDGVIRSAGEVIYRVSQENRINPKLILALLQKEQSLLEDPSPTDRRLDWATGYGVCDSCSIDHPKIQQLKGFSKQVDAAAWQFRQYLDFPSKYKIQPASITAIDGETVVPANRTTAGLYNYTPHRTGNENFSRIWQRYFGDPLAGEASAALVPPQATYAGQSTAVLTLEEGAHGSVIFKYKNTGTSAWMRDGAGRVVLADVSAKERLPSLDANTISAAIADTVNSFELQEQSVAPGEVGSFVVPVEGSPDINTMTQHVVFVWEGRGYLSGTEASVVVVVRHPGYAASVQDASLPASVKPVASVPVTVHLMNRGKWTWDRKTFTLELPEQFKHATWKQPTGRFIMKEEKVEPGKSATFSFSLRAPDTLGEFPVALDARLSDAAKKRITKELGSDALQTVSGLPATVPFVVDFPIKSAIRVNNIAPAVKARGKFDGLLHIENTGTETWKGIELRSTDLEGKRSPFYSSGWVSPVIVVRSNAVVPPGKTITVLFPLVAPKKHGTYRWAFSLKTHEKRIYLDGDTIHEQVTRVDT